MIARSWCEASEAQQLCGHACYAGDVNKHPAKIAQYVYCLCVCCACVRALSGATGKPTTFTHMEGRLAAQRP